MKRSTIALALLGFIAFALVATGIIKYLNAADFAEKFGNDNVAYILGTVEIVIAVAIAIPRTRMLGIILAASYFGGAIAISWLVQKELPAAAAGLNAVLYLGAYLYRPSLGDGAPAVD